MQNVLTIRKVISADAQFINQYWMDATDDDLLRLGELTRPDPVANVEFIKWFCSTPSAPLTASEDIRIWCAEGKAIGYSSLKNFQTGSEGQIHLHLTRPFWGKGFGPVLFCLSAKDFIDTYQLNPLYCQPKSENPMPNRMLQKIGFRMLGPVDYQRKDGSTISQNRYLIDRATIENHLKRNKFPLNSSA